MKFTMPSVDVRFVPGVLQANYERKGRSQTVNALFAGLSAGILGLTGIYGVLFFILTALVSSTISLLLGCREDAKKYFPQGKGDIFSLQQIAGGAMTYILVWTLAYDAIYLF